MLKNLGLGILEEQIEITPIKPFKTVVNTFGNKITGNVGIYQLTGDVHILNLLYQLGIGSRRSQGFGMYEIVSEVK